MRYNLGVNLLGQDRYADAVPHLRRALELIRGSGMGGPMHELGATVTLAGALQKLGETAEAQALLERARAIDVPARDPSIDLQLTSIEASQRADAGDVAGAFAHIDAVQAGRPMATAIVVGLLLAVAVLLRQRRMNRRLFRQGQVPETRVGVRMLGAPLKSDIVDSEWAVAGRAMAGKTSKKSTSVATKAGVNSGAAGAADPRKTATKAESAGDAKPRLLSGGNPQIAKGMGDAPVQAYIAAMPGWKSAVGQRLDALIERNVPGVRKAVKWNSPFYGAKDDAGWFLSLHVFTHYIKVTFFRGMSLRPVPPGASKTAETRYLDLREGELDEAQFVDWVKQASRLPGERL